MKRVELFDIRSGGDTYAGTKRRRPVVRRTSKRFDNLTLGSAGIAAVVSGIEPRGAPGHVLVMRYDQDALLGLDRSSMRVFRYDGRRRSLLPIWNSGVNVEQQFVWAKVQQVGTYLAIGLPRDRLLQEALRALAYERGLHDIQDAEFARDLTLRFLQPFLEQDERLLDVTRERIMKFELDRNVGIGLDELDRGFGGHFVGFPLPGGQTLEEFRKRVYELDVFPAGLPEEVLFRPVERNPIGGAPWTLNPKVTYFDRYLDELVQINPEIGVLAPWYVSKDWPMYQHDTSHTGKASGSSSLTSTTVGQLVQRFKITLDGPVNTKPSIVDGKAYIGTGRYNNGPGGTLYKVDLCSGCIDGKYTTAINPHFYSIHGIGGSPAIYKGKAYFTTVEGDVYCLDTATMSNSGSPPPPLWVTNLKVPDAGKNQPVNNPAGDCWSSPLVVNDRVYVGSGEGEVSSCWGFIWCLNADTGQVLWLFCTNKAQNLHAPGNDNLPNHIPRSAAVSDPLPAWAAAAGYVIMDDPPETGSSPWSSFAYDYALNRVYVGTGNSEYETPGPVSTKAPDEAYGSGLIALDATTGQFRGFHQAQEDDSYHPNDLDIDVPGAPTLFTRGGERVICYGSKNGSFFLLDPDTMEVLGGGAQRRQLLARQGGTGHPGNRGAPITGVATSAAGGENKWGVMATPAVHAALGKIFVGLGGYSGAGDGTKTPFIRALNWNNLNDAWATVVGGDGVARYTLATPPVYVRSNEAALSSPAVVNDVVFVSTTDPANSKMRLYALDAATGLCLWAAPSISNGGWPKYALGPAISGEYVVQGADESLYVYTRPLTPWCLCLWDELANWLDSRVIDRWWLWPIDRIQQPGV